MPHPRVCVLRAPGTNCDIETSFAFEQCGAKAERVHLFRLLEQPKLLADYQILCIPGGFSYGDDVGAGVIFANQLRGHLASVLHDFLQGDKLTLGICNGFQVLLKAGVIPGDSSQTDGGRAEKRTATLTWNDSGRFIDRWVHLRTAGSNNVFLRGITELDLPIAHAEGKLVVTEPAIVDEWRKHGQIGLCYAAMNGASSPGDPSAEPLSFPANPNGSVANIAGLGDRSGRAFGLMPHPERFMHRTQHPHWTRKSMPEEGAGLRIFRNAVEYFAA